MATLARICQNPVPWLGQIPKLAIHLKMRFGGEHAVARGARAEVREARLAIFQRPTMAVWIAFSRPAEPPHDRATHYPVLVLFRQKR
jgi:hypothetical protein